MFPFPPATHSTLLSGGSGQPPQKPAAAGGADRDPSSRTQTTLAALIAILGDVGAQYFRNDDRVNDFLRRLVEAGVPLTDHANVARLFDLHCLKRQQSEKPTKPRQAKTRRARAIPEAEALQGRRSRKARRPLTPVLPAAPSRADGPKALSPREGASSDKPKRHVDAFLDTLRKSGRATLTRDAGAKSPTEFQVTRTRSASIQTANSRRHRKTDGPAPSQAGKNRDTAGLNDFGEDGLTSLMRAVMEGEAGKVAALLKSGADPTPIVMRPDNPIENDYEHLQDSATLFLESAADPSRKNVDAAAGFVENGLLRFLPSLNSPLSFRSQHIGRNALTMAIASAASEGLIDAICVWSSTRQQSEKGRDLLNQRDGLGNLPLCMAAEAGNDTCANLLIKYGANLNDVDARLRTPLMHAASCNNPEMVSLLLKCGASSLTPVPDGASPLSLAHLNKRPDTASWHAEVQRLLLTAIPKDFSELCKTINEDRERSNHSDASKLLRQTITTICKLSEESSHPDDEALKSLAVTSLTSILKTARDDLNSLDLMKLATFPGMKVVDQNLRMEALYVALNQIPMDWGRLFTKPRTGAPSSSIYLKKFEKAMLYVDCLADLTEREGDETFRRAISDCQQKSWLSVCQLGNIYDFAQFLPSIGNLREPERHPAAFELLLKRAPLEWEQLLQASYEEFGENGVEEGHYDLIVTSFNHLATLRSSTRPDTRRPAEACLHNMWTVTCKEMTPGELARFVDKVGGATFRMNAARLYLLTDVVGPLLEGVIETVQSLGKAPGTAAKAANLFIEAYKMTNVLLSRDVEMMRNAPSLSSQRKLVSKCFNALTAEGKEAVLDRLTRGEIKDLRDLIIKNITSEVDAAKDLHRIDEYLVKKSVRGRRL